jgi:pyrroline-5-carboxylate reductase
MLEGMLIGIEDTLKARTTPFVIVSMVAGRSIAQLQQLLGFDAPIIRIMPNTPVSVGAGMILYSCSREVTQEAEDGFLSSMSFAGRFARIDEHLADIGSVVSGCGPAFAALMLEALADGGVACGLPRAKAQMYAAQMMLGTAALALETGRHPGQLKDAVCSPGGTTIQGVRALERGGFRSAAFEAVIAAYEATLALAKK